MEFAQISVNSPIINGKTLTPGAAVQYRTNNLKEYWRLGYWYPNGQIGFIIDHHDPEEHFILIDKDYELRFPDSDGDDIGYDIDEFTVRDSDLPEHAGLRYKLAELEAY